MVARYEPRVAPWKKHEVEQLTELLRESPIVGVAQIDSLPSRQFQEVRAQVRGDAQIRVAKNTLIERAINNLDGEKPDLEDLEDHIEGQTALLLSDANPFKLFQKIEGSKANAPAKPGDIAPKDIWIEKGDTPFQPGPVVGDLQKAGMPAKIEGGKVVIAQDKLLVEEGEEIGADLASALTRLEIHPMIVGLDLKAVWDDGTVFDRDVLDVDPQAFLDDMVTAHASATGLAIEVGYPTAETVPHMLAKAVREVRALALESGFPDPEIIEELVSRGHAHASALSDLADYEPGQAPEPSTDVDDDEEEAPADDAEEGEEPEADDAEAEEAEDDEEESEDDDGDASEEDAEPADADEEEPSEADDTDDEND